MKLVKPSEISARILTMLDESDERVILVSPHMKIAKWYKLTKKLNELKSTRIVKKLNNIHPGEVLKEEFLDPLNITAYRLSKDLGVPQTRISEILKAGRRISADTALRPSKYFGNSAKFWLGLQDDYDYGRPGFKES